MLAWVGFCNVHILSLANNYAVERSDWAILPFCLAVTYPCKR